MFNVIKVKLNYMDEAAGVVEMPRVSWQMVSDDRNCYQKAYQIQIAENERFNSILYDGGVTESRVSADISLTLKLQTAQRYFIRIKVQNSSGIWSEWSTPVSFFSGIINNEWQAKFISVEAEKDADNSKGTYLRQEVFLGKRIESVFAYVTALGLYHFYINGQRVGADEMTPGWTSYHKHLMYQSYDVTELLKTGINVFGAHIGAGWYKGLMSFNHIRNIYGKKTAFLAEIHVKYVDGSKSIFATDENWQGDNSPVVFSEIYDGEIYDARLEQAGWNSPAFDGSKWKGVQVENCNKSILSPQYASKTGINDHLKPKQIFQTPKGETVLDFGQNMTGWIEFFVQGKEGDKVKVMHILRTCGRRKKQLNILAVVAVWKHIIRISPIKDFNMRKLYLGRERLYWKILRLVRCIRLWNKPELLSVRIQISINYNIIFFGGSKEIFSIYRWIARNVMSV